MERKCNTDDLFISIRKEHEAGAAVSDLARRHGVSENTNYRCRSKFGDIEVLEAKKLRELKHENS